MRRIAAGVGIVAGIVYLGWIVVLLVGQARAPVGLLQVDASRTQLRSAALESAEACRQYTEGRATLAYVTSSSNQLADQARSVVKSLDGAQFTGDASEPGRRVADAGHRLADALGTLGGPDAPAQASQLRERLLGIAEELSR